jgi:hypothetical protein
VSEYWKREELYRRLCGEVSGRNLEWLAAQLSLASVPELVGYITGDLDERERHRRPWPWWKWLFVLLILAPWPNFLLHLIQHFGGA